MIQQFNTGLHKNYKNMKVYTIAFMDNDYNDLVIKNKEFNNLKEAKAFAKEILANLCDNDITTFRIY